MEGVFYQDVSTTDCLTLRRTVSYTVVSHVVLKECMRLPVAIFKRMRFYVRRTFACVGIAGSATSAKGRCRCQSNMTS